MRVVTFDVTKHVHSCLSYLLRNPMYRRDRLAHGQPDGITQLRTNWPLACQCQPTRCIAAITSREAVESRPEVGSSAPLHAGAECMQWFDSALNFVQDETS